MAKALSQVYTIIRGSVGGLTYLANQYHQIVVRARTAPVQPGSIFQTWVKTAFSAAQAGWRLATQIQMDAWDLYAKSVVHSGPMGNYTLTGRLQCLSALSLANYLNARFQETIDLTPAPPVDTGWFLMSNFNLAAPSAVGTGFSVNWTNDELIAAVVLVQISPKFKKGKNFYKGPWDSNKTFVFDVPASTSGTADIIGLVDGGVYFVKVRAITNSAEHRISETFIARGLAEVTAI